jgi:hypothetical protein
LLASGTVGTDAVKHGTVKIHATSRAHTLDASTNFGLSREGASTAKYTLELTTLICYIPSFC